MRESGSDLKWIDSRSSSFGAERLTIYTRHRSNPLLGLAIDACVVTKYFYFNL